MNLKYSIYKNISNDEFIRIKNILIEVESEQSAMLFENGFIKSAGERDDSLAVDFVTDNEDEFSGNIGFCYDDLPGEITFTFYILKGFDQPNKRFYEKRYIFKNKALSNFLPEITKFFLKSIEIYKGITKSEMTQFRILE